MKNNVVNKLKLFIGVIFAILPFVVNADMGAPMISYKVRVSNPDGAYLYDYYKENLIKTDKFINFDEILTIEEGYIDNENFEYSCSSLKICGYINLKNTKLIEVDLNDYYHENAITMYAFDDSNYLYTGPSFKGYEKKYDQPLEIGYTFTTNYYDEAFAYIPEKDAWVYIWQYFKFDDNYGLAGVMSLRNDTDETKFLARYEANIYDSPKDGKIIGKIPKDTEFSSVVKGFYGRHFYGYYYLEYNGIIGYVKNLFEYHLEENLKVGIGSGQDVNLLNDKGEIIGTIPFGTVLSSDYQDGINCPNYRVKYQNKIGWVSCDGIHYEHTEPIIDKPTTDDPKEEDKEEDIIPVKDKISMEAIIIISVLSVIILSLTAIVIILLINKKKEKKVVTETTDNIN